MKVKLKSLKHSYRTVDKTQHDKVVHTKLTKQDYIKLLFDVESWPLSCRIAAELFRSGVTLDAFERSFHLEQNSISKRVYEYMAQFHLGRGPDPARVTPVLPVYLRYVSPVKIAAENRFKGRPSTEDAIKFVRQVIAQKEKDGWHEVDFIKALRAIDEDSGEPIKVKSFVEEEPPQVAKKVVRQQVFSVFVRGQWLDAPTKQQALKLQQEHEAFTQLAPVESPQTHCAYCKFPLNSTVVTLREDGSPVQNMHFGCYMMNVYPIQSIPVGMRALSPADGVWYEWKGVTQVKGEPVGWVRIKPNVETLKVHEKVSIADAVGRVPPATEQVQKPGENQQAVSVSTPADPTRPVLEVRKTKVAKKQAVLRRAPAKAHRSKSRKATPKARLQKARK